MTEDEDPLEDLYVDKADIDKTRLRDALSGLLGIDRESGNAVMLDGFSDLSQSQKIIAYLLYRRVAMELGHVEEADLGISTSELNSKTGVPEGTISSNPFSDLIQNDENRGGYLIPDYAISDAIAGLEED